MPCSASWSRPTSLRRDTGRAARGLARPPCAGAASLGAYGASLYAYRAASARRTGDCRLGRQADLSAGHLRTHLAARREQGLSNASAARELSALKSFIAFARTQAGREVSDAPRMRGPRIAKGLPRPVTPDDAIGLAVTGKGSMRSPSTRGGRGLWCRAALVKLSRDEALLRARRAIGAGHAEGDGAARAARWGCPTQRHPRMLSGTACT